MWCRVEAHGVGKHKTETRSGCNFIVLYRNDVCGNTGKFSNGRSLIH